MYLLRITINSQIILEQTMQAVWLQLEHELNLESSHSTQSSS